MAVFAEDEHIDPVGSCVGQKGIRVTTVMSEIGQEKIDIIPWSADTQEYIANSLSPARIVDIQIDDVEHKAFVEVLDEHLSLAIGKGGQNVRLAAKLTGWKIEIKGIKGEEVVETDGETVETHDQEGETHDAEVLSSLKSRTRCMKHQMLTQYLLRELEAGRGRERSLIINLKIYTLWLI
jgi:N utilization substance protein A